MKSTFYNSDIILIYSNVSTAKKTIKQITILVLFSKTVLTKTSIVRNSKSSEKVRLLHIAK